MQEGCHGLSSRQESRAEPNAAPDRGGMTAFRGSTARQPPQQVSVVVGRAAVVIGPKVYPSQQKPRSRASIRRRFFHFLPERQSVIKHGVNAVAEAFASHLFFLPLFGRVFELIWIIFCAGRRLAIE